MQELCVHVICMLDWGKWQGVYPIGLNVSLSSPILKSKIWFPKPRCNNESFTATVDVWIVKYTGFAGRNGVTMASCLSGYCKFYWSLTHVRLSYKEPHPFFLSYFLWLSRWVEPLCWRLVVYFTRSASIYKFLFW